MPTIKGDPTCTRCVLHTEAQSVCLMGRGAVPADVMIVGEAPGYHEDESGKPFVGKAGKLLDEILKEVGVPRSSVYVTNAVKCRPPDNRTPKKKESQGCSHWLSKEIRLVKPKYVLLLGSSPTQGVLDPKLKVTKARGQFYESKIHNYPDVKFFPTFHPAAILRDPSKHSIFTQDIKRFFSVANGNGKPEKLEEDFNYEVVLSFEQFEKCIESIQNTEVATWDIETTGLNPWAPGAEIVMWQVDCWPEAKSWVIPLSYRQSIFRNNNLRKAAVNALYTAMDGKYIPAQNGKFDSLWALVRYGVDITIDHDTMLADHILDENRRHGLKELASLFFGAPNYDIDTESKKGKGLKSHHAKLFEYAARDVYYTRKLYLMQREELAKDPALERLYYELVVPVGNLYRDVEYRGFYVDTTKMKEAEAILSEKLTKLVKKIDKFQPGLNYNSPQQVSKCLFEKYKLPILDYTKTGNPSTAESVLQRLSTDHKLPSIILEARETSKFLGTFLRSWEEKMVDSRLHPTFKIQGTVTGRPSCKEPNMQQVPRDRRIRSLITAPPGWTMIEADYSQAELRIAAVLAREPTMLKIFKKGGDIHSTTAESLVGGQTLWSPEEWKDHRKKAKAVNFGFLYGMGAKGFRVYARDKYGIDLTEEESYAYRERFFSLYAGLPHWHDRAREKVRQLGYVRTMTGRKRRLPDIYSHDKFLKAQAERQAINSPVQGTAAEMTLMAAVEMDRHFDEDQVIVVGTIHDAILMEVRDEIVQEVLPQMKVIMEKNPYFELFEMDFPIPIIAELSVGSWGSGIEWEG